MRRPSPTETLLAWFDSEKRQLPWRGTTDPYRIWVSEVMLQQTTVGAVRKRYDAFLSRFPDVASLARAREDEVLAAWSGLGYYARARNLRRAAAILVGERGGVLPRTPPELESLPGFGPYMAAAVASLAFGERVPAAEANVERVVARAFALAGRAGSSELRARVLERAERLLPRHRPGDLTAALMDLGQTVCTPRKPICPVCPIAGFCEARLRGSPDRFPERGPRPRPVRLSLAAAVARRGDRVLLVRRRSTWLDALWEFPSAEGRSTDDARGRLAGRLAELGLLLSSADPVARARHSVVNRRLEIAVFPAVIRAPGERPRRAAGARWFRRAELAQAAVPTLTRKIAAAGLDMIPARQPDRRP